MAQYLQTKQIHTIHNADQFISGFNVTVEELQQIEPGIEEIKEEVPIYEQLNEPDGYIITETLKHRDGLYTVKDPENGANFFEIREHTISETGE
ncbi:hypothetical protein [Halogeometricum sp. CBA1124]|uniref:hypothetical protein n=1 Tax=Halogeometricum sp. CBA1124 TaxID=2668071 RepID=UPI00142C72E5|nr:hypothetical protein [Halogeometricum sp. CBA1124]MUV56101.1 hypothetical protein [Halogeometricum sp. CBA1124]